MPNQQATPPARAEPAPDRRLVAALLVAVVALGVTWRMTGLTQWPSAFHQTRQYDGALLARRIWLEMRSPPLSSVEENWLAKQPTPVIELPLTEFVTASVYWVSGGERPWVSAIFAAMLWLAGGWFVFSAARQLVADVFGGILALAYYLLAPWGIALSRSFQPEALMICGFAVALWWLVRQGYPRTSRSAALGGLVCGLTLLIKPGITLIPVLAAFVAIAQREVGIKRLFMSRQTFVFLALLLLPSLVYTWIFLGGHVGQKFLPSLLADSSFYRGWWQKVHPAFGWPFCAAAILGAGLMVRLNRSFLGVALLLAYVLFCLLFTWHSSTHSYYHATLIVIIAICLAPLPALARQIFFARRLPKWAAIASLVVVAALLLHLSLGAAPLIAPAENIVLREQLAGSVEALCGDEAKLAYLGEHYGKPLTFHSWLPVVWWPQLADKRFEQESQGNVLRDRDRLKQMLLTDAPPTHFVVTNLTELKRQSELAVLLESVFRKIGQSENGIIYDLRQSRGGE